MQTTITVDDVMRLGPCAAYPRQRVEALFGAREAVTAREVAGADIPLKDRVWLLIHTPWLTDRQRGELACDFAERTLPSYEAAFPDDGKLRAAIETKRRRLAGEATDEEMNRASAAASAAAGRRWQIDRILTVIEESTDE